MKELPYKITTKKLPFEAQEWCTKNMGERYFAIGGKNGNWTMFWAGRDAPKNYNWHFRHEEHATWFALRWE